MNYTVSEKDMKNTLVAYLESEGEQELSAIMNVSEVVYDPRWEFTRVNNQRKLYMVLKVPVAHKKYVENKKDVIAKYAADIYQDDEDYGFYGVSSIGITPIKTSEIEFENKHYIFDKDSIYSNFIQFIISMDNLGDIQKKYLFEACNCGSNHDLLAASVMLGASAEILLLDLCSAYEQYLDNNSDSGLDSYRRKVMNARCAYDRLTEFLKRAESNATLFKQFGIDNLQLAFSFFDIIRKVRNNSGHPTGTTVSEEELKVLIGNYQHYLPIMINIIDSLPSGAIV